MRVEKNKAFAYRIYRHFKQQCTAKKMGRNCRITVIYEELSFRNSLFPDSPKSVVNSNSPQNSAFTTDLTDLITDRIPGFP